MGLFQRAGASRLRAVAGGLFAVAIALSSAHAADTKRKVIIDDDNGFSLMHWMLLQSPDVEILGIGAVTGDLWRDEGVATALRALELNGRTDIPVLRGAEYPLVNSEKLTDRWEALYGKLVWKGVWMKSWVENTTQAAPPYHAPNVVPDLAEGNPTTKASDETAANFMIRKVHEFPGEVTIIAAGPMTDLALAQRLDPEFAHLARELVYMGGSLNPHLVRKDAVAAQFAREYANSPRREFNFRFDPEAVAAVLRAPWRKITMVPVDPATATEKTPDFVKRIVDVNKTFAKIKTLQIPGFPLWDELAAAVWLDPSLVTRKDNLFIDVNSQFGPGYGDTLSWTPGYQPDLGEQNETVIREIDPKKLEDFIVRVMSRPVPQPEAARSH